MAKNGGGKGAVGVAVAGSAAWGVRSQERDSRRKTMVRGGHDRAGGGRRANMRSRLNPSHLRSASAHASPAPHRHPRRDKTSAFDDASCIHMMLKASEATPAAADPAMRRFQPMSCQCPASFLPIPRAGYSQFAKCSLLLSCTFCADKGIPMFDTVDSATSCASARPDKLSLTTVRAQHQRLAWPPW
ncbi:hypothetical protein P280DRAFT_474313 [Massarina eburnea CBS 473.64]|uniref:Uncharacterized protein n=1 Tax=Massarina eburnea CBS 473.64 TaxID=1395130 RepID=A0A6A6RHA6_9PLEO|nr:hypothetical protein P280DRAFT_474313 [Massarina eburnea CBS 473.64]